MAARTIFLKGLLGITATGGAATASYYYSGGDLESFTKLFKKKEKKIENDTEEKVGVSTTEDTSLGSTKTEGVDGGSVDTQDTDDKGSGGSADTVDTKGTGQASTGQEQGTGGSGQDAGSTDQTTTGGSASTTTTTDSKTAGGEGVSTTGGSSDSQDTDSQGTGQASTGGGSTGDKTTTGGTDPQASTGQGQGSGDVQITTGGSDTQDTGSQGTGQDAGSTDQTTTGGSASTTTTTDSKTAGGEGASTTGGSSDTQDTGSQGTGGGAVTTDDTTGEDSLGFPKRCNLSSSSGTPTCDLSEDELKKLKFDAKDSGTVTVTGLSGTNKVKVTVTSITDTTYTKGKKYTFTTESGDKVKISNLKDGKEITIEKGKNFDFKENDQSKLEYVPGEDKFGIPTRCKDDGTSCELSAEEIKNIKFKDFDDSKETSVTGVSDSNKVTLKIEKVSGTDATSYPNSKKYTLSVSSSKVTITSGSTKIEVDKDKEVVFKESSGKLEKIEGVDSLGLPEDRCKFGTSDSTKECELTEEDLKKIKFKDIADGKATVEGLSSGNKVKLKIEKVTGTDASSYKDGKKYTFSVDSNNGTEVTIKDSSSGSGDDSKTIKITKEKSVVFKEGSDNKLEKVREVDDKGIPKDCKDGTDCTLNEDDIKKIKFKDFADNQTTVEGLTGNNKTIKLKVETVNDDTNYPKKKKYTFKNENNEEVTIKDNGSNEIKLTKTNGTATFKEGNDNKLEKVREVDSLGIPKDCVEDGSECDLGEEDIKKLKFKDGSGTVSVTGLASGKKIKLKVEKKEDDQTNYPKNKKYTFSNKESSEVTIKNGDSEVMKLAGTNGTAEFREENSGGKLEKVKEVDKLGIPKECKDDGTECKLDENDIKQIKFKDFGESSATTVTGLNGSDKVTLKIEKVTGTDASNYPNSKKYTLSVGSSKVTIKNSSTTVEIDKDKSVVFKETSDGNKLEKVEGVDSLGLPEDRCKFSGTSKECELTEDDIKKIKFKDFTDNQTTVEGLSGGKKIKLKIETSTDSTNYSGGKKYTFTNKNSGEVKIKNESKDERTITLSATNGTATFKETSGKLEKVREVDDKGIPSDCTEGKECTLNEEDIKKLKFKDGSGTVSVEGLGSGKSIKLKVENKSSDTTNYPKGKKYTFSSDETSDVTIKNGSSEIMKLSQSGGSVEFRETESGGKLEKIEDENGIPVACKASEVKDANSSKTCTLSEEQLKKIKFKDLTGTITVTGVSDSNKVTLKIEHSSDSTTYPNNKKYTFSVDSSNGTQVTIKDSTNSQTITIDKSSSVEFKESSGKLEKVNGAGSGQGTGGGSGQGTGGSSDGQDTGSQGTGKGTGGQASGQGTGGQQPATTGSGDLGFPETCGFKDATETKTCELTKEDLEKIKFDVKSGSSKVEVSGLNTNNKVKVTVTNETTDKTTYTKGKKYTFTTDSDDKVKISSLKDGKEITLEKGKSFYFKENEQSKLEYVDGIDKLGIPVSCKADEVSESNNSKTCELTKDQMEKIKFEGKADGSSITMEGLGNDKKVTLTIKYDSDSNTYPQNKKYSFKATDDNVKIKNAKDNDIDLPNGQEVEFKENSGGDKLEKVSSTGK